MAKINKKGNLLKNTVMLYILTFSGYVFNFITMPYQTRVLGPVAFGILGFASACAIYVQLFLDFGFLLSSTEDVSNNRDDKREMSRILSAVTVCKLGLGAIALVVVLALCMSVPKLKEDILLYMLYFASTFINALLPDFLYRGIEKMSAITVRAVSVKAFFTVAIFIFLRSPEDYYIVPLLNSLGAIGACVWTYFDVYKRIGVRFMSVEWGFIWKTFKRSSSYFWSRIATSVYGATNTVIIKALYPTGPTVGLYSSSEKLMTTARSAFSPSADSMYPYMVKNKDYKLVKKVLVFLMPLIILGCTGVFIFAEPFCVLLFGEEFAGSAPYLRLLLPIVAISLPTYIFGFPVLSPLGLAKYANISVIIGAVLHAVQLAVLYFVGIMSVKTICIATCITEFTILTIRIIVVIKNRNRLKATANTTESLEDNI